MEVGREINRMEGGKASLMMPHSEFAGQILVCGLDSYNPTQTLISPQTSKFQLRQVELAASTE